MRLPNNFKSKNKYDIKITIKEYIKEHDYVSSKLILNFKGTDINLTYLNSLRRVTLDYLPIYAIPSETIKFTENTSIPFDNSQLRLRFGLLPVYGIDTELYYLNDTYWRNINYEDNERPKHENEKNMIMFLNVHNKTENIITVSTNDLIIHVDDIEIKPYNEEYPIQLVELQKNDKIICTMKPVIGVGHVDAKFRAAKNAVSYYENEEMDIENENNIDQILCLMIESSGQIGEFEILCRSCKFIEKKFSDIKELITNKFKNKEIDEENEENEMIYLTLENEDYTVGNILNWELQNNPNTIYSGVGMHDKFIENILIKLQVENESALNIITNSIDIIIDKYNYIGSIIDKLYK
jgi:DNA-directed RNA polymerase subunit L